ncbi:JAB domain-containing protein [Thiorhodococcus mannitoliphagus]|uniref:JAB domain-containing protein n=1 Tax=Thiorhodococcus mannitoliphagus TaxID=329406 RepID=A0A6P1DS53_9GAMM|nr:DNA repair protein RadC [Thiorhodococcus mannitoliphagus]NEX18822.1 JAB domain-containing protein [Thiorhodococcus mannitoliphagus]
MTIKDWPEDERPREKMLAHGAGALSDAELLAIFLRTGVAGRSAVDLARDLLASFGGLTGLLAADQRRFCAAKGLGTAKFTQLQAVLELSRRYLLTRISGQDVLTSPEATRGYLKMRLYSSPQEIFACLFLDNRHRVIRYDELFYGTIDGASVHPREVVRRVIETNAAAVIFAHNHPSGVAEPSQADLRITQRLKDALAIIEVRVLDHIIVGDGEGTSFAERGLL